MPPHDIPGLGAVPMSEESIDELLREQGYGVLSLARGGEAYAVPMSFGYDGDRLFCAFLRTGEESTKAAFADATDRASLLVSDVTGRRQWRSALVRGPLAALDDGQWAAAADAVRENAWYPQLFAEATPARGVRWWVLDPEDVSGRTVRETA
ncbi:MAG: pyridoxamine 5'-phosphate oxidase family protein [Halobacteriaceae archaeon]